MKMVRTKGNELRGRGILKQKMGHFFQNHVQNIFSLYSSVESSSQVKLVWRREEMARKELRTHHANIKV
jgi:hypothetical protein